ncbi:MAG: hypothetical protein ABIO16_01345 [Nocardioides sp.]
MTSPRHEASRRHGRAGSALFVVLIWGQLNHIAYADEAPIAG